MKQIILIAVLIAGFAAAFFFVGHIREFFRIDDCMDSGGCWDYQDKVCRKDEPDAQQLCDRSKP